MDGIHFIFMLDGSSSMTIKDPSEGLNIFGMFKDKSRWEQLKLHLKSFFDEAKNKMSENDIFSIFIFSDGPCLIFEG